METSFAVSIDVEEDSPKWRPEYPYTLTNINAIPDIQKIFDKYRIKPTYLLTYSVANDKKSAEIFKKILDEGKCEIGSHLHPWTNYPVKESEVLNDRLPCDLEDDELNDKFCAMTEKITEVFGINPTSYRAGRYGLDKRTLELLVKYNYIVDTSVTPYKQWKRKTGLLSFLDAPVKPYYIDKNNLTAESKNDTSILEVPLSIIYGKKNIFRKKSSLWLRPSYSSFGLMKKITDILIEQENPILNIMFHSNELALGQSIFSKRKSQVESYWNKLDKIFNYITNEKGIKSRTLSEFAQAYGKK